MNKAEFGIETTSGTVEAIGNHQGNDLGNDCQPARSTCSSSTMYGSIRLSRQKAGTVLSLSASPQLATDHIEVTAAKHRRDVAANILFGRYKLCPVEFCLSLRMQFHPATGGFRLESLPWLS